MKIRAMPYQPNRDAAVPISLGGRPRILVVKLATLGDLLLATPMLRALRQRYPEGRLDLLTTTPAASLLIDSPLCDRVIAIDKHSFDTVEAAATHPATLTGVAAQLLRLRRPRYDALVLAHHLTLPFGRLKYRLLIRAIRPRVTVGLDNGHGEFLDLRAPDRGFGALHEADYGLQLAAALDAAIPSSERRLDCRDLGWTDLAATVRASGTPPHVALHPGSGSYSVARRWPLDNFAELAKTLHERTGAKVVILAGPAEVELGARLLGMLGHPAWASIQANNETPRQLAETLSSCDLMVGNDSFPMHLAVALHVPTIGVFGPTNARAWGPYTHSPGTALYVRRIDLPCSPCIYRGHALGTPEGCPARPCLTGLPASLVLQNSLHLLNRRGRDVSPAG